MKIESNQTPTGYKVIVKDVIKTIEDSSVFKKSISDIFLKEPTAQIEVHIVDSYIITSSIIGTLLKTIQKDGANISIHVYNQDLYELLERLNLITLLNVQREFRQSLVTIS